MSKKFKTGMLPTPKRLLAAARPFEPMPSLMAPSEFAVVPTRLSVWGNNKYGCCVSSEEAFAKAAYSVMCGVPQTFITEQTLVQWAGKHNWLNGAYLTEVMDAMASDGIVDENGKSLTDGPYTTVDYSNEPVLQAALLKGPVKVGIGSSALPSTAGRANGWFTTRVVHARDEDHCVGLAGFGSAGFIYDKLKVSLPSGLTASVPGYALFTWGTIGFVTHDWIMGTMSEAWLREPTTPGQLPAPPAPPVPPAPPTPPAPPVPTQLYADVQQQTIAIPLAFGFSLHANVPAQRALVRDASVGVSWGDIPWQEIVSFANTVVPIVLSGIESGKPVKQILLEVVAALIANKPGVSPAFWTQLFTALIQLLPMLLKKPSTRAGLDDSIDWAQVIAVLQQLLLKLL